MHGLTGGGWKRSTGHGRGESCPGETLGRSAETYRRPAPPRQPPTLLRYGNSAHVFDKIQTYTRCRLAIFIGHRHKRSRAWGWRVVVYASPDQFGLINLDGLVIAPRPNRPWRSPNTAGEGRR